jgi:hypothetical protein
MRGLFTKAPRIVYATFMFFMAAPVGVCHDDTGVGCPCECPGDVLRDEQLNGTRTRKVQRRGERVHPS